MGESRAVISITPESGGGGKGKLGSMKCFIFSEAPQKKYQTTEPTQGHIKSCLFLAKKQTIKSCLGFVKPELRKTQCFGFACWEMDWKAQEKQGQVLCKSRGCEAGMLACLRGLEKQPGPTASSLVISSQPHLGQIFFPSVIS